MKVYIDGEELSSVAITRKLKEHPEYQKTNTAEFKPNTY